jgi:hypothetical protein
MSDNDISQAVIAELHREHGSQMAQGGSGLYLSLEHALKMLPRDGVEWAVAKPVLAILARSEDTLFQIVLDPEKGTATLVSRPLKCGCLSVGLVLGEPSTSEEQVTSRETSWTFRMAGEADELDAWKRITGRIATGGTHGARFDRRERLARKLARSAGWEPPLDE